MEKRPKSLNQTRNKEEKACKYQAGQWCVITGHKCPYEGMEEDCLILLKIAPHPE